MKNVYYPLAGMNYIIDDLAENYKKQNGRKKGNCFMAFGTG